jgi:hypothetical protein
MSESLQKRFWVFALRVVTGALAVAVVGSTLLPQGPLQIASGFAMPGLLVAFFWCLRKVKKAPDRGDEPWWI